jgi:hypothetical protein
MAGASFAFSFAAAAVVEASLRFRPFTVLDAAAGETVAFRATGTAAFLPPLLLPLLLLLLARCGPSVSPVFAGARVVRLALEEDGMTRFIIPLKTMVGIERGKQPTA